MSKHYNRYNRPMVEPEQVTLEVDPVEEAVIEATVEAAFEEPVEEPVIIEEETVAIEEVLAEPKSKVGVVVDCDKLRVRKHPSIVADILCVIPKGAAVVITGDIHADFYPVCTETGVQGWCMKKYIKVQ